MPLKKLQKTMEFVSIGIFVSSILYLAFLANQGVLWEVLAPESIIAALSIEMALLAAIASIVASYAFVFFLQDRQTKNLILSILGGLMIPITLLYLISHPGFPFVTPFPPMDYKNDVISIVAGITVTIGLLSAILAREHVASRRVMYSILALGAVLVPIVIFSIALIPASVIPDWELINNVGLAVGVIVYAANFLAIVFYSRMWKKRNNSIPTGIILGMSSFTIGSTLLIMETAPNEVLEIASMFMILVSMVVLALPIMATSITEPHRGLSTIIRERTEELTQARDESKFYLNIWTHEVGNILQGILIFLESLELLRHESEELTKRIQPAKALAERATQTIRQVADIATMKKSKPILHAINVESAINVALKNIREQFDMSTIKIQLQQINQEITINADALFADMISKFLSDIIHRSKNSNLLIHVMVFDIFSTTHIEIRDNGPHLSNNAREYLTGEASALQSEVGLDLFIVRNLLQRYRAMMSIETLNSKENLTILKFDNED